MVEIPNSDKVALELLRARVATPRSDFSFLQAYSSLTTRFPSISARESTAVVPQVVTSPAVLLLHVPGDQEFMAAIV